MSASVGVLSGTAFHFPSVMAMTWRSNEISDFLGFTMGSGSIVVMIADLLSRVTRSDYIAGLRTSASGLRTTIRSDRSVVASGRIGPIRQAGVGSVELDYDITPAPPVLEPETYAMLLAGLHLMAYVMRRRSRNALPA